MTHVARRRLRPPSEEDFSSRLRGPAVAARVGTWLGVTFTVAFLTGVWSHLYQDQPDWLTIPAGPVWLYRVTQGLHTITGVAAVPLLLVKLYAVLPKFFAKVPWRDLRALVPHLLERASITALVTAAIFQLVTGIANSAQFYPWSFSFRSTHYAVAWIAIGALVIHIAVKLPLIRDAYSRDIDDGEEPSQGALTRRGLVGTAFGASGLAVLAMAGGTVPWLRNVSVFATHSGDGPQGVPINKSAKAADVVAPALDPSYALSIEHGATSVKLSLSDLQAMPQHTERLPIACVEGWSANGDWTGVRIRDLLDLVEVPAGTTVNVISLQPDGPFRASELRGNYADDPRTLVALRLNGDPLSIDHGYPCRLIAPNRPGVLQTKWLAGIEVAT